MGVVERAHWDGLVVRSKSEADLTLVAPIRRSNDGGSGAFEGRASDGRHYWLKPLNNLQGPMVSVTEQIVGRVGGLIDAPVCPVKTIAIPEALVGWEFRIGARTEQGISHGSLSMPAASEVRQMTHRDQDSNARRHCGILALYDWCWGGDSQWLLDLAAENAYHSHDHGWYLPPEGPTWTSGDLERLVDEPHSGNDPVGGGISADIAATYASALESVSRPALVAVLNEIPSSWPVSAEDLEAVGYFLERRARPVAQRLRERFR